MDEKFTIYKIQERRPLYQEHRHVLNPSKESTYIAITILDAQEC